MLSIKTAHDVAQESSPKKSLITTRDDTTDIKSPTQHTRFVFQWLCGIMPDKEVPSSAFEVAFAISQYLNRETGEAFPSTDTIAADTGLSQSTVRDAVTLLQNLGHLHLTRGSRGRGHPNKYRPIIKERTAAISDTQKERTAAILDVAAKERFGRLKERSGDVKERRSAMNNLITTLTTKKERAYGPPSSDASLQTIAGNDGKPADAEPLKLIPRAADAARIAAVADQKPPCQASASENIGAAAIGNAEPAKAFDAKEAAFERLKRGYPPHRVGDEAKAYRAFCAALAARGRLSTVVEAITNLAFVEHGADVPLLSDALSNLECVP
jgi:DNA-binding transcriptional regulator YhcF (GntR family)